MFNYFSKKSADHKINARKQALKYVTIIESAIDEMEEMQDWPVEKMMDAKDRQHELLKSIALLDVEWNEILDSTNSKDLEKYKTSINARAPYMDDDGIWHNPTTLEVRNYPYPTKEIETICPIDLHTSIGFFARMSADYFVLISLKGWVKILSEQVLERL